MWNYNNSNNNQSLHSLLNVAWVYEVEKYFVYKIAVKNATFWEHKSIPGGWYGPGGHDGSGQMRKSLYILFSSSNL